MEPIQESYNSGNNEENNDYDEQYSRYDPKELRDAARILSPFLKLVNEVNNPYARIVAREVCKTFHSVYFPNKHPLDVMQSFYVKKFDQKTTQVWDEFMLYNPEYSLCREWVPLCKDSLVEIDNECNPCRTQEKTDRCPADRQQCPDTGNFIRRRSKSKDRNRKHTPNRAATKKPRTPNRQSPHNISFDEMCGTYQNLCDISPPADMLNVSFEDLCDVSPPADMYDDRCGAGSDSLPANTMSEHTVSENETDDDTLHNDPPKRQQAGDDVYLPYCKPGCSKDADYMAYDYVENPVQYEYYRVTGNSSSPRRNVNDYNVSQAMCPRSPVEPELRTNALDDTEVDEECEDSDESVKSQENMDQIKCKAKMVANAFTTVSLAQQEVDRKKNALNKLTKNYLNYKSNPIEEDPPHAATKSAKKILKNIYKNPPKALLPFDNGEWNDNCFKDKDFVRLLPFYEVVHNQLEYISKAQRDYGVNMLDDIVPVFYHIHYELGDPRLKNELLVDHVKLVTKNTWESFFYPGDKRMPAIPEKPELCFSPSYNEPSMSQHLSPVQLTQTQASPRPSNVVPPVIRETSSKSPKQECQPPRQECQSPRQECQPPRQECQPPRQECQPPRQKSQPPRQERQPPRQECQPPRQERQRSCSPDPSGPCKNQKRRTSTTGARQTAAVSRPSTAAEKRPRTESRNRPPTVPQKPENPPVETKKSFLRRSKPSGNIKGWAPKIKAVERPKDAKTFKAKPLPKFVRDRLDSRDDENC